MKNLLLKRILPFMMAIVMLASFCLPVGAFTVDSPGKDDDGKAYYTIELDNGILRVTLNPQKVYDALKDGDFTREELEQFVPRAVLDTLSSNPSMDDLLALASEYLSKEDVQSLIDILPKDILTEHFLNVGFLESLITLDEILSLIPLDELLADVENPEKFNSDLNEMLTPYLDLLMTDTVVGNLMENSAFMETVLADAIDLILADEDQKQIVMNSLPALVTEAVVDEILGNESYKNALIQMIIHNDAVLDKFQNDPATIHKLAEYLDANRQIAEELMNDEDIVGDLQRHPDWLINEIVVKYMFTHDKLTPAILHQVFGDDVINDLVAGKDGDYALLDELLHSKTLIESVVGSDSFTGIAGTLMTDELFKLALSDINPADYVTLDMTFANKFGITPESLLSKNYITLNETFLSALGITLSDMVAEGYITLDSTFAETFGITAQSLVDKGYVTLDNDFATTFGITPQNLVEYGHVDPSVAATLIGLTFEQLIANGWINVNGVLNDTRYGITPEAVFAEGLVDVDGVLNDTDYGISAETAIDEGIVDIDAILADVSVEDIFAKDLVDVEGIFNDTDYNITLDRLGLTGDQLQNIARTLLENDSARAVLMDTFTAKVKAEEILPSVFVDCIDFKAIALDEDSEIDLVGMIEDLLTQDANAEEHLSALFAQVTLSQDDLRAILSEMGHADCMAILEEHFSEIVSDLGGPNAILKHIPDQMALVDALFGDGDTPGFLALVTPDSVTGVALINYDEIAIALGGVNAPNGTDEEKKNAGFGILVSLLDPSAVVAELGDLLMKYVSFSQVVEAMGGFTQVLKQYDNETILSIVQGIGAQRLIRFLKENGLLKNATITAIGKDIAKKILDDKDRLKAFIANGKDALIQIMLEDVATLQINNTVFFKNGILDLQTLVYSILSEIPDVEDFCKMVEGDSLLAFTLKATYHTEDAPSIFGIDVCFDGDFSELQALAEYHKDLFSFDVTENLDMLVTSTLPEKVADLYAKVLESDKLPATLKEKLLLIPTLSVAEIATLLEELSDEELNALAEAVNEKLDEVLLKALEKSDAILDKIPDDKIDQILDVTDKVVSKLPEGAIDRVTAILSKLRTPEGADDVVAKVVAALRKIPASAQNLAIDQFYTRDGNFYLEPKDFSVNLADRFPSLSKLPEGLVDLSLSGSFETSVTFSGVYRLTLTDEDRNETVFFLPAGISLDVLNNVSGLDLSLYGENLPATMPAQDTVVHMPLLPEEGELIFVYHEPVAPFRTVEFDRIRYTWGDTTLAVTPKNPPEFRGYLAEMPDYLAEMNIELSRTVHVYYTASDYVLTFNHFNGTNTVIPFGVNSDVVITDNAITLDGQELPALTAPTDEWTFVWKQGDQTWATTKAFAEELVNLLANDQNALSDITLTEARIAKEYTLTFLDAEGTEYDEILYTIDTDPAELSGRIPNPPAHPVVGFEFKWILVNSNGAEVDPATDWSKDDFIAAFRAGTLANLTVQAKETFETYTYTFVYLTENGKANVVVPYTIETSATEFAAMVPAATVRHGYTYYWATAANVLWSAGNFQAHNPNTLGNYTIYEQGGLDTYHITITLLDGSEVRVSYDVHTDVNTIKEHFNLPENTKAYSYKWQKWVESPAAAGVALLADGENGEWVDWDPESFTMDDLDHLTLRQVEIAEEYTFTIYKQDGSTATVTYTFETSKNDLVAALLAERNANTNGYTYTWEIKNGDSWSAWNETSANPGNINFLNDYEIRVVKTANTYTITFDMGKGNDITVRYTIETLMENFTVPAHTNSAAYIYNAWLKGADAWTLETLFGADGVLSEDELASYTVTETGPAVPYTLTFRAMSGQIFTLEYTIETSYSDFVAMIPALGTPANAKAYERYWLATGETADWTADAIYGSDHALSENELTTYTLTENERTIVYTITFRMSDNKTTYTVKYDVNGLKGTFPALTYDSGVGIGYYFEWQRDGATWDPETFSITEFADFTVTEVRVLIPYIWTFIKANGETTEVVITYGGNVTQIKNQFPKLESDSENVYSYNWYYQGAQKLEKFNPSSWKQINASSLVNRVYTEIRTINDNNTITFQEKDGTRIDLYYYDKENFYIRDDNFNETPVPNNELPTAKSLYGYTFDDWYYTNIQPNQKFDVETFRQYITYGNKQKASITLKASYTLDIYTLTFIRLDNSQTTLEYNVETDRNTLGIPQLPVNNNAFIYYWTDDNGSRWSLKNLQPQTDLKDLVLTENQELLEYVVTFVRADGTRKNVLLTFETTRTEFNAQIPVLVNNAAFDRNWTYNGAAWTIDSLFTNGESIEVSMLNDYRIEENEIAYSFMLTFKDLEGNLINQVIYNGHGPLFGQIPTLPSSDDGYAYSWWNVTDDAAWAGFDPLACRNLELRLTREPIVYNIIFKVEGQPDVHETYTVLDHSFTPPAIAPKAGFEHIWYYMEGETQHIWTKDGLTIGDLVLYSDFVHLKYTITFTGEDGTEYIFVMTVDSKSNPSVPPKAGHIGTWYVQIGNEPAETDPKWTDYKLIDGSQAVKAYVKYSPLPYYVDFMIDGVFFGSGTYSLGGDWTPLTPPEKAGYRGDWFIQVGNNWVEWSEYSLENGSSKVSAKLVYTPIVYTANFFADGKLIGTTNFTVEDTKLSKIPTIPAKNGFTAEWSAYQIGAGDLEIHAIYTEIEPPAHPLDGKDFLLFIDGFVGGLYDNDPDGLHWIWWLIILLLIILIIVTLILLFIFVWRKKEEEPTEEPEPEPEPTPEEVPTPEEAPEAKTAPEILDSVDVETADTMMADTVAMAALETVGGAKASGMKSIINISKINDNFDANDTVDIETLKAKKMIPAKTERLKVLGDGHLDKPLTVVADSFSLQAIKMITLTGGKAVQKKSDK